MLGLGVRMLPFYRWKAWKIIRCTKIELVEYAELETSSSLNKWLKPLSRRTRHHKLSLTDSALKYAREQSSPVSIAPNECPHAIEDFHEFLLFHQIDLGSIFTHDRLYTMPKSWGESNSFRKHSGTVTSTLRGQRCQENPKTSAWRGGNS